MKTSSCKGGSVGVGEAGRDKDTSSLEVDVAHTVADERQQQPAVELERVVGDAGHDLDDAAEATAALLDDLEADELEGVVLVLPGRRERLPRTSSAVPRVTARSRRITGRPAAPRRAITT